MSSGARSAPFGGNQRAHNDEFDRLTDPTPDRVNVVDSHTEEIPLPEDAYGAAFFALIYDAREIMGRRDHDKKPFWFNLYRLCYVLSVLLVNYVFQGMMLWWINDFVVQPSVHSVQDVYMQYHGLYFTEDGVFRQDVWDQAETDADIRYKKDLCHMVFSQFYFLWFVLMMWTMIMVIEFRSNATLLKNIYRVPACPNNHPELMIQGLGGGFEESEYDDDKLLIVGLTPFVRILVFLFILIPKFFIGFFLMMLGMTWLSATESFSELMLNSLALEFVIRIDDHLFKALLPETYRQDMQKAMLNIPKFRKNPQQEIRAETEQWRTSTFYFVFFMTFTFLYLKHLQGLPIMGVLPFFRNDIHHACEPFLQNHKSRLCSPGAKEGACFPYGLLLGA